jgi:hypothetical protein
MADVVLDGSAYLKIVYRRGDTFALYFPVTNADGSVYDLTGHTVTFDICSAPSVTASNLSFNTGNGLTLSTGLVTLSKSYSLMNVLRRGQWWVYMTVTYPDGTRTLWVNGQLIINEGIYIPSGGETYIGDSVAISVGADHIGGETRAVEFTLSSSQILALENTTVQYLAPIAANKYAVPFSCDYIYYFGGIAYTRNSSASISHFWDNVTLAGFSMGSMLTQTFNCVSNVFVGSALSNVNTNLLLNKGLFVRVSPGTSFTLGNGTLKIKVLYHVVTV